MIRDIVGKNSKPTKYRIFQKTLYLLRRKYIFRCNDIKFLGTEVKYGGFEIDLAAKSGVHTITSLSGDVVQFNDSILEHVRILRNHQYDDICKKIPSYVDSVCTFCGKKGSHVSTCKNVDILTSIMSDLESIKISDQTEVISNVMKSMPMQRQVDTLEKVTPRIIKNARARKKLSKRLLSETKQLKDVIEHQKEEISKLNTVMKERDELISKFERQNVLLDRILGDEIMDLDEELENERITNVQHARLQKIINHCH